MLDKTNEIASTHLGKKSESINIYSPSLLVAIPRAENRKQYNLEDYKLPFQGYDIWHCYEFSCLTNNGFPITRVLKIKYNCNSKFLVESKSLKLYLNSFNMSKFGKTIAETLETCKKIITKDLTEKLQTEIELDFLEPKPPKYEIFNQFENLLKFVDISNLKINSYKEAPEILKYETTDKIKEYYLTFDSLRSNCRVTHQPDFGDVFIYYKSNKHVLEHSLIQYLTSFRTENHFHEECCEMIFKRLNDLLENSDELFVCALYTRRGGIDITPIRYKNCTIKDLASLTDTKILARNGIKQ